LIDLFQVAIWLSWNTTVTPGNSDRKCLAYRKDTPAWSRFFDVFSR